jgi:hypothetical protein
VIRQPDDDQALRVHLFKRVIRDVAKACGTKF